MMLANKIAQFGTVGPPAPLLNIPGGRTPAGLATLLNIALRSLIVIAGIITVFNIVLAGYGYLTAEGDPKKISEAGAKIWQSILGLVLTAGSVIVAAVIGQILFGDPNAILRIQFFIP